MTRDTEGRTEERFPITAQGYTSGEVLDGTDCEILIDIGASKSYMSKSYFLKCKSLHTLPKVTSNAQRIQVGNGQYVGVLFVIPVILTIREYRFEVFTLGSEIYENVDLVLGLKNIIALEGLVDSWDSCPSFLNGSIPFSLEREGRGKTKRAETNHGRGSIYRGNIRNGHNKIIR